MNLFYVPGRQFQYTTGINWSSATLKALLVMTNTTAHLDLRATFLTGGSGFAVLDEFNGSGYSRQTLGARVITDDTTSQTGDLVFSWPDVNFGATVGNGTRQIKGMLVYLDGADDTARRPLLWIDSMKAGPAFPYSPGGGPVVIKCATEVFRLRSVAAPA